ncbi:MAG TPA: hypothetical protein P5345_01720, partial [Candidatus Paceibacterota bacterium]|nr:hypothetical protein [Candidatus Paceibacterota bacterium]
KNFNKIEYDPEMEKQERWRGEIEAEVEKEISEGKYEEAEVAMLKEEVKNQSKDIADEEAHKIALEIWKQIEVDKRFNQKVQEEKEREERIIEK